MTSSFRADQETSLTSGRPFCFFSQRLPQKAVRRCPHIERISKNAQAVKNNWAIQTAEGITQRVPTFSRKTTIQHRFFAWDERQWLWSRFMPGATSLRSTWSQQPHPQGHPQPHGHGSTVSSFQIGAYLRAACLLYLLTARSYASTRSCRTFVSNVSSLGSSTHTQDIRPYTG